MLFAAARKPLWRLCVDCDEGKLQAFLEGPEPVDMVPLGRLEYSVQELLQGLHLLRNLSWSKFQPNKGTQQASVVMKKHRTLGHELRQTRSILGQIWCPFAEPDEVRKLRTCRKLLHRLAQSRSAVTRRHMFVSEMVSPSSEFNSGAVGNTACSVARRVVSHDVSRWRTVSDAQKSVFVGRAATWTREKIRNMQRNFLKPVTCFVTSSRVSQQC